MKTNFQKKGGKNTYISKKVTDSEKSIDFEKINKDKIEEYIKLMEEHQLECVQNGNFIEAELARQRVVQMMKIKEKKDYKRVQNRQVKEMDDLNKKQKEELKEFKDKQDIQYAELMSKFETMKNELKIKHDNELNSYIEKIENSFPSEPKVSNELTKAKKQLEYYIKQKDYPNAHLTQVEIEEITLRDREKFEAEKEKRIDKEIGALRIKQKTELDALELKISIHQNKFYREREIKNKEILLKYKNKARGLETTQKAEREEYERIIKGKGISKKYINYDIRRKKSIFW